MHITTIPNTDESRNNTFENHVPPFSPTEKNSTVDQNELPWYMQPWSTPVTAVLQAYVSISFLFFFIMFMRCMFRHGCCHMCRRRRRHRERAVQYQQMLVRRYEPVLEVEQQDDDDDTHEINSVLSRDLAAVDVENGARVHDIQRLDRALRAAGMA